MLPRPTTAGISRARATIDVWDVRPPTSVTKPDVLLQVELDRIGRRKIVGHNDGLPPHALCSTKPDASFPPSHDPEEPLVDVVEVLAPFPKVRVLHLFEAAQKFRHDDIEGPFGVDLLLLYRIDDLLQEELVLQDQDVGVDDERVLPYLVVGYRFLDRFSSLDGALDRSLELRRPPCRPAPAFTEYFSTWILPRSRR